MSSFGKPNRETVSTHRPPIVQRVGSSDRQTLEVGVTGSHQNAAAGHRRDDAAKSARAQTVIDIAGGAFCHAELRVCGSEDPMRSAVRGNKNKAALKGTPYDHRPPITDHRSPATDHSGSL
jgi:hypothetical protein